ncbi:hypothetical protein PJE062_2393 [Pseudovibrio sp. JE062]|nr:hypothetical protein PJE062_2393 [Pseudovibrio sp. JE062]
MLQKSEIWRIAIHFIGWKTGKKRVGAYYVLCHRAKQW